MGKIKYILARREWKGGQKCEDLERVCFMEKPILWCSNEELYRRIIRSLRFLINGGGHNSRGVGKFSKI